MHGNVTAAGAASTRRHGERVSTMGRVVVRSIVVWAVVASAVAWWGLSQVNTDARMLRHDGVNPGAVVGAPRRLGLRTTADLDRRRASDRGCCDAYVRSLAPGGRTDWDRHLDRDDQVSKRTVSDPRCLVQRGNPRSFVKALGRSWAAPGPQQG